MVPPSPVRRATSKNKGRKYSSPDSEDFVESGNNNEVESKEVIEILETLAEET